VLCFYFVFLRLVLSVYLNRPFLIVPSVFSNVYFKEAGTTYHSPAPGSTPGFVVFLEGSRVDLVFVFRIVFRFYVSLFCVLLPMLPASHISLPLRFSLTCI
jgi:hypothetical protein